MEHYSTILGGVALLVSLVQSCVMCCHQRRVKVLEERVHILETTPISLAHVRVQESNIGYALSSTPVPSAPPAYIPPPPPGFYYQQPTTNVI